jgi:GT2 family glycosyltransferase
MTNLISLSIIIIGRNEGWKLTNCFRSIFETITYNDLTNYEIIYVDSKSSDDSIERVKKYPEVKILQLTGDCNAAIARNVGAAMAQGKILFFLDGDMELIPSSFDKFYSNKTGIEHPFLSGNLLYYYYDHNWNLLRKGSKPHKQIENDIFENKVGGMFLISRNLWEQIGGMKNKLDLGEDTDLAFRLAKIGISLLRKKEVLVTHHTIDYLDTKRKWKSLRRVSAYKAVLYRENILSIDWFKLFIRQEYTLILILLSTAGMVFFNSYIPLFLYLLILFSRSMIKKRNLFSFLLYFPARDLLLLISFVFFIPRKKVFIIKLLLNSKIDNHEKYH